MRRLQRFQYIAETSKELPFIDCTDRFLTAKTEYILNFSSNVVKITLNDANYFFKETKKRPASIRTCICESIDVFFEEIIYNPNLKARVLESLKIRKNLRLLINMGSKNTDGDPFNKYLVSGDESCIGLPLAASQEERQQLKQLVFYLYGEWQNWFLNLGVKVGELQTFSATRALATGELAKMLKIDYLIPRCDFVKIKFYGKEKYGILSEAAEGNTFTDTACSERAKCITPSLLRALTDLNLLDVITRDNDHRVGNYHIVENASHKYTAVSSYDNDGPDSFGLSANVRFVNLIGCSAFLDKRGLINRAHLDEASAMALLGLRKEQLMSLRPYLSALQLLFLNIRINKVRKAILKTARSRASFLLAEDDWCVEHIHQDLSSKYGKTYLASLLSDCYYETGMHAFDTL